MDPRIQQILDRLRGFVEDVQYVPPGGSPPDGFTHTIQLTSLTNGEYLTVAIKTNPAVTAGLDLLLGFV
jgi:hypothetical protein